MHCQPSYFISLAPSVYQLVKKVGQNQTFIKRMYLLLFYNTSYFSIADFRVGISNDPLTQLQ